MNCENCQNLLSEAVDGSLNRQDLALLEAHVRECLDCAEVRRDLSAIVGFCAEHRGEYDAPANERALWLRISNSIEAESWAPARTRASDGGRFGFLSRSWHLSFPQLAASVAAIVLVVALGTVAGVRWLQGASIPLAPLAANNLELRYRQQQQVIDYWNQRVEMNKARWNPQMRETFDRNMSVIDAALNDSMRDLKINPHDEVSEEVLNAALNDKVQLLREFAEL